MQYISFYLYNEHIITYGGSLEMARKVCMFVYNNFLHDTRVLKEARTLVASGYDVTVLAALDTKSKPFEELHVIKIIRVKIPIHYRIFCLTSVLKKNK